MHIAATNPDEYIDQLPDDRKIAIQKLRGVILQNLSKDYSEVISYGMISYVVPLSIYPQGYLNDPQIPLPYLRACLNLTNLFYNNLVISFLAGILFVNLRISST